MPRNEDQEWKNLLFTDPEGAVERIKAEAVAESRAVAHRDYTIVTNRERWNKMFYSAYPSLATHKEFVEQVMVEVGREMPQNTPIETANHEIATRVEARIKHRDRFGPIDRERAAWSGGPGFSGPQPPTPEDQGQTLGETVNARRLRRQQLRLTRSYGGERI